MTQPRNSLMRSLGQCLGHIAKGVKAQPRTDRTVETKREVTTEQRSTPAGEVTLRRTVIEEISVPAERLADAASARSANTAHKENPR